VAWRYLPLAGVSLLCVVAFIWRPRLQLRRHGTRGIVVFQPGNRAQFVRECCGVLLLVLLLGQAIAAAWWPETLSPLGAEREWIEVQRLTGAVLLFGGIALLAAAQLDLGASWRIGIEEGASPGLVTGGLYRFCRNPIFLALIVIVAGYALLLPTRLSLILFVGAYIGVRQQVSAEEAYLLRTYGDIFRDYARRVGRFLPGIGRLR
jgi:protein-S-isoprenylcysteine O-methyltransferase Ste14